MMVVLRHQQPMDVIGPLIQTRPGKWKTSVPEARKLQVIDTSVAKTQAPLI